MSVIEVWSVPRLTDASRDALKDSLTKAAAEGLGPSSTVFQVTLFPADVPANGGGGTITATVWGLPRVSAAQDAPQRALVERLGRIVSSFFPEASVVCGVHHPVAPEMAPVWTTQRFENPDGAWSYKGPLAVTFADEAYVDGADAVIGVRADRACVEMGYDPQYPASVAPGNGGLVFSAGEFRRGAQRTMFWRHAHVTKVTRPDGSMIWVNPAFRHGGPIYAYNERAPVYGAA